ncbi:MAG: 50S ribosomal protein L15 [Chloroflexota bacterium]
MRQDELSPAPGSRRARKRVWRGDGSGHGSYSGRGSKGQKSRSGTQRRPGLEGGGVMPSLLRLPQKRGFHNIFATRYSEVNVAKLSIFPEGSEVTPEEMYRKRLINTLSRPVKILGEGELSYALNVRAEKFSSGARTKIEAAGGKAEEI